MTDLHIPKISTPQEIAVLVKAIDVNAGAALIQQYANTVAAAAKCQATDEAYEKWDTMMRQCMARRTSPEEYDEQINAVDGAMREAEHV